MTPRRIAAWRTRLRADDALSRHCVRHALPSSRFPLASPLPSTLSATLSGRWLEDLAKDLRYAFRTLRRNPGFSAVAVLLLALGTGANVAIFSLINAVTLRTLPVKAPERLVQIARIVADGQPVGVSYPMFEHFRDHVRSLSGAY